MKKLKNTNIALQFVTGQIFDFFYIPDINGNFEKMVFSTDRNNSGKAIKSSMENKRPITNIQKIKKIKI